MYDSCDHFYAGCTYNNCSNSDIKYKTSCHHKHGYGVARLHNFKVPKVTYLCLKHQYMFYSNDSLHKIIIAVVNLLFILDTIH